MCARVAAAAAVGLLALSACTDAGSPEAAGGPDQRASSDSPSSPASSSGAPRAGSTGTTGTPATTSPTTPNSTPEYVEPLVLAFDVHRRPLRLTERQARLLASGDVSSWRVLGQSGRQIVVRRGPSAVDVATSRPDVLAVVPASSVRPTVQVATVDGIDPMRQPARYPITTPAGQNRPEITTVVVAGDIMLGRRVASEAPGGAGATLLPLSDRLAAADMTIGNLESTLSDDGFPRQGDDSFAADPSVLRALDRAGFDLLSMANNHTGDYGDRALRQTLRRIEASPIHHVGAGQDAAGAWRPIVLESDGIRFGFVAFNAIGETPRATRARPGAAEIRMQPRTGPLNRADLDRMRRTVSRLAERVDVVMVLPHWGDQYTNIPHPDQRRVGAALVRSGADVVVGGHPHWVQGVQVERGGLIAHSLGNFVFDMDFSVPTREGALMELVFWGDVLRQARFTPYVIGADFAPRLVRGPRADRILDRIWETSDAPFRR
ncbi:MAG: CapA family protein [Nocardioidaceae bacterium]